MSRKRRDSTRSFADNNAAITDYNSGRTKKTFTLKDLKQIFPRSPAQEDVFHANAEDKHLLLYGSPGVGKSFLALNLALREVLTVGNKYKKVIIVRSIATVRDPGSLPGELDMKVAPFEEPYLAICNELFQYKESYQNLKKGGYIEFVTTSYLRGMTFGSKGEGAIVIFDECQNATWEELSTVITRVGHMSKIMFCGDYRQCDIDKKKNDMSGLGKFLDVANLMECFTRVEFTVDDIVRSSLVKDFIIATMAYDDSH